MRLLRLECHAFRCLSEIVFEPSPGLNVIHGGNAQGKTTLLEAILYAATSKSHRTNADTDLPQYGSEQFHVRIQAQRTGREVDIEAHWWQGAKRFKVNGIPQTRLSDILGRINVVFFSPEDVELVKGGASARRRFLDMEISQIHPGYLQALQQYRQVLRQRNELLRDGQPDPDLLAAWDAQLVMHGTAIVQLREEYIAELGQCAAEAYEKIAQAEPLAIAYQPDVASSEDLAAVLAKSQASDIKRRATQRGPHRDDLDIRIAGQPARSHASQGQQKSAALALKLAELELVNHRAGEYPVFMLDEVLAELDAHRVRQLLEAIHPEVQCLLTTTDGQRRSGRFETECAYYRIERGRLEKE